MSSAKTSNAPASDTMSQERPEPENLSESDFLKRQGEQARQAIQQTLEDLKGSLQTAADYRLWADHHPWITVAAAAAAGFAAGSAVTSAVTSDHAQDNRAFYGPPPPYYREPAESPRREQPSAVWSSMLAPLLDMGKIAVQSAIASAMGAAAQTQAQSAQQSTPDATSQSHSWATDQEAAAASF